MRVLATLVVVDLLLLGPLWILSGGLRPHLVAIEALAVVGLFLLLPARRWSLAAAWVVAVLVVTVSVLSLADATARMSLARSLNLYLDIRLAGAVSNLLSGTLGTYTAIAVIAGGIALALGTIVALAWLLAGLRIDSGRDGHDRASGVRRQRWVGAVVLAVSLALIPARWLHPRGIVFGLTAVRLVREQSVQLARMLDERERFDSEMTTSPSSYRETPGLLAGLGGRDVVMAFIESYGMTVLEDSRYAPVVRPRLEAMERAVGEAGLHMATGRLVAPSQGGQSWLGHGSVLSGLWLENQLRYDLLLASDRETLVDDFEAAGYRTVAIMPAITMAWPEGERFGYDRIYAHADIDYAGPPLNWVTMPDQFTWSFLERVVRDTTAARPLFAELGLISSHAPWTPILPVVGDWESIGDGSIFEKWADTGEAPEELWLDPDRVREHYALAVGYAVDAMAAYAVRFVDDRTVLIALGDHQPAPLITGDAAPRSVPVHVVVADPGILQRFLDWGFAEGGLPDMEADPPRMDAFRDWFVRAFSDAARETS